MNIWRIAIIIGGLATVAVAQRAEVDPTEIVVVPRDELTERRDQGRPFWETQWIVRADGTLTQLPNPAAGGGTKIGMSFVGDEFVPKDTKDPLAQLLLRLGPTQPEQIAQWIAPLLRNHGDLLGATGIERHFAQLGRDASDVALRQFLAMPATATGEALVRRDLLDRELAVRLLQQRRARNAKGEIAAVLKAGDSFLQRAAAEAMATFDGTAPPPGRRLDRAAIAVPAHADLWVWIDPSRFTPRPDLCDATRTAMAKRTFATLLNAGGRVNNVILSKAQYTTDLPDELPYEAARLWGRARVDECLLCLRVGEQGLELQWAAASGAFEVDVIGRYLDARHACKLDAGRVSTEAWWPGFEVELTHDRVVVRRSGEAAQQGTWPAFVADAAASSAAFAALAPADSKLDRLPWLLLGRGDTATVALAPFALRIDAGIDAKSAADRCKAAAASLRDAGERLALDLTAMAAALGAARVEGAAAPSRSRIEIAGENLDPLLLWPLLR